jgi:hypothetical protein
MSIKSYICELYVIFTKSICDQNFDWGDLTTKDFNQIAVFIDRTNFDRSQIRDMFTFQFHYWNELKTQQVNFVRYPLSWIIGSKAIKRFNDNPFKDLTKAKSILKQFNIQLPIANKKKLAQSVELLFHEEQLKKKFIDSDLRLLICMENTSLFKPSSPHCQQCTFQQDCKNQLQVQYPNVFLNRGLIPQRLTVRRVC